MSLNRHANDKSPVTAHAGPAESRTRKAAPGAPPTALYSTPPERSNTVIATTPTAAGSPQAGRADEPDLGTQGATMQNVIADTSPGRPLSEVFDLLQDRLLKMGGKRLVRQEGDEFAAEVLARGRLFDLPVKRKRGQRNRCHANAADLWARDPDRLQLATGYGLSDDGLWRLHSWAVGQGRVIETTEVRLRYFGFVHEPKEAARFWWKHSVGEFYADPVSLLRGDQ